VCPEQDSFSHKPDYFNHPLSVPWREASSELVRMAEQYRAENGLQWGRTDFAVAEDFIKWCLEKETKSKNWPVTYQRFLAKERTAKRNWRDEKAEAIGSIYSNALYGSGDRQPEPDRGDCIDGEVVRNVH
jgi:hypothetical protein